MRDLSITSNKETITAIEEFFSSPILSAKVKMKLKGSYHESGYSAAIIVPLEEGERIPAEDIFWMGFYSGLTCEQEKQAVLKKKSNCEAV